MPSRTTLVILIIAAIIAVAILRAFFVADKREEGAAGLEPAPFMIPAADPAVTPPPAATPKPIAQPRVTPPGYGPGPRARKRIAARKFAATLPPSRRWHHAVGR